MGLSLKLAAIAFCFKNAKTSPLRFYFAMLISIAARNVADKSLWITSRYLKHYEENSHSCNFYTELNFNQTMFFSPIAQRQILEWKFIRRELFRSIFSYPFDEICIVKYRSEKRLRVGDFLFKHGSSGVTDACGRPVNVFLRRRFEFSDEPLLPQTTHNIYGLTLEHLSRHNHFAQSVISNRFVLRK